MSSTISSKSLVDKITKGSDNFIKSKWSLIVFLSLIVIAGLINYLLFGLGIIHIKTPWLKNVENGIWISSGVAYIGWISITLSLIGSIFNIWAFILITRLDKRFIWLALIACATSVPNEFFLGAVFTSVCFVALTMFEVGIYLQWKKDEIAGTHGDIKPVLKKHYVMLLIVWAMFVTFGLSVSLTSAALTNDFTQFAIPIMDVLGSSMVLVCWSLALLKNRWGLFGLIINDNVYIVMYAILGVYSMSATFLIFLCMNIMGFLGWSRKRE